MVFAGEWHFNFSSWEFDLIFVQLELQKEESQGLVLFLGFGFMHVIVACIM